MLLTVHFHCLNIVLKTFNNGNLLEQVSMDDLLKSFNIVKVITLYLLTRTHMTIYSMLIMIGQ